VAPSEAAALSSLLKEERRSEPRSRLLGRAAAAERVRSVARMVMRVSFIVGIEEVEGVGEVVCRWALGEWEEEVCRERFCGVEMER
jgi:hypothetical protein